MIETQLVARGKGSLFTLEEKLDVIVGCIVDIASAPGIPEFAIITIRHQADKIKEHFQCAVRTSSETIQLIVLKLESVLAHWMEHMCQCAIIQLSKMIVQAEAKSLFYDLNVVDSDPEVSSFAASAGWFEHFKNAMDFVIVTRSNFCLSTVLEHSTLAGDPVLPDHSHVSSSLPASPRSSDQYFVKLHCESKNTNTNKKCRVSNYC